VICSIRRIEPRKLTDKLVVIVPDFIFGDSSDYFASRSQVDEVTEVRKEMMASNGDSYPSLDITQLGEPHARDERELREVLAVDSEPGIAKDEQGTELQRV